MAFPKLRVPYSSRQMVDVFKGYNHNLRIGDGEFYDMKNLTSDDYPVLSTRGQRGFYTTGAPVNPVGLIAKDNLCYVDGGDFVINGKRVENFELLTDCDTCKYGDTGDKSCSAYAEGKKVCQKRLISMGAYVIILPDKKWYNTVDDSFGNIDASFTTKEPVTFSLCMADGNAPDAAYNQPSEPGNPEDGARWIDTSTKPCTLKQWSASSGMWVQLSSTYVKIYCTGIGKAFEQYDGVKISGLTGDLTADGGDKYEIPELAALEGSAVVWDKGDDYIVIVGILSTDRTITNEVTVSREMPAMDHVIECGNRLWGCRYGTGANGETVNVIYSSKLGDFKNWNCYMGIATDSWYGSVGTDGPFTGAISHLGYPLFFKENHLHKVHISASTAHQVTDTPCQGVQRGCGGSLALVGNVVYYKGRNGVCAYDGSLPVEISQAFGGLRYENAVGGGIGNKYYVSMDDTDGGSHLFVYDSEKDVWHKEDDLRVDAFCACRGELYAIAGEKILGMLGTVNADDEQVEWMAESGLIGLNTPDMKYISRLVLRLQLPEGACLRAYAEYDSSGRWTQLFTIHGHGMRAFSLPVRPARCDHMRLRMEGEGPVKLFSITKTIEQGSDVR